MNYSTDKTFPEALAKEKQFTEFFRSVKALTRNIQIKTTDQRWEAQDYELSDLLLKQKMSVHEALCDYFDTPRAVNELSSLVIKMNTYMQQPEDKIKIPLVRQVSRFIFHTLRSFGVYEEEDMPTVMGAEGSGTNIEDAITPLMNALSKYRDSVKQNAGQDAKELFKISD